MRPKTQGSKGPCGREILERLGLAVMPGDDVGKALQQKILDMTEQREPDG